MNIARKLMSKPWLTQQGTANDLDEAIGFALPAAKIGLRVLCVVIAVLFFLFVVAYNMRMGLGDWRPVPEPGLLWFNTLVLGLSSVALQWARMAAAGDRAGAMKAGLAVGGVLTFVFLAGQLVAWRQLNASGYFVQSNPANSFFYVITALHGLHMLGGLVAWGRTMVRAARGATAAELSLSVQLCVTYWHFLFVVWVVLFGLLLST